MNKLGPPGTSPPSGLITGKFAAQPTGKIRPAIFDISVIGSVTLLVLVLTLIGYLSQAGRTRSLSEAALAVIILGGFVNTLLLVLFRDGELKRKADPYYTIPKWRPSRLASILVLLGWACSFLASFWVGLSWSRR